jgi:hypothetical protein
MWRRFALAACILLTWTAPFLSAQRVDQHTTPFDLGRAALDAHDPATAIAQFEQVATPQGHEWLAVALMMESRSPSDSYVERAFESAQQARLDQPERMRSRTSLAATLRPGDIVITFLVGETHAYAWAFDREVFVGYPLPPSAELATAIAGARGYMDNNDEAGVQRIAEQLMPALLGPVEERLAALNRVVFVTDGPLQSLSVAALAQAAMPSRVTVLTTDYSSLFETLTRLPSEPHRRPGVLNRLLIAASILTALFVVALVVVRSRRTSVP